MKKVSEWPSERGGRGRRERVAEVERPSGAALLTNAVRAMTTWTTHQRVLSLPIETPRPIFACKRRSPYLLASSVNTGPRPSSLRSKQRAARRSHTDRLFVLLHLSPPSSSPSARARTFARRSRSLSAPHPPLSKNNPLTPTSNKRHHYGHKATRAASYNFVRPPFSPLPLSPFSMVISIISASPNPPPPLINCIYRRSALNPPVPQTISRALIFHARPTNAYS